MSDLDLELREKYNIPEEKDTMEWCEENGIDYQEEIKITVIKELIANILEEVSKFHPNYPVYGYDYVDGKLVSVVREQHTIENRCVACGAIIPEGRQVCPNCMEGFVLEQE